MATFISILLIILSSIIGLFILLILILMLRKYIKTGVNKHFPDLKGQTFIITGGNSGIGKEAARVFYKLNAKVIITGRSQAKADDFIATLPKPNQNQQKVEFYSLDFGDLNQIKKFAEEISEKYEKIDVLVNNAGLVSRTYQVSKQGIEKAMACNHVAHVYLTSLLFPLLSKGHKARVINISSEAHREFSSKFKKHLKHRDFWLNKEGVDYEKDYFMMTAYGMSKFGNLVLTRELDKFFKIKNLDQNMKTCSIHPGNVAGGILRNLENFGIYRALKCCFKPILLLILKSDAQGAATTCHCSLAPFEEIKGNAYYGDCKDDSHLLVKGLLEKYSKEVWIETGDLLKETMGHDCFVV